MAGEPNGDHRTAEGALRDGRERGRVRVRLARQRRRAIDVGGGTESRVDRRPEPQPDDGATWRRRVLPDREGEGSRRDPGVVLAPGRDGQLAVAVLAIRRVERVDAGDVHGPEPIRDRATGE